MQQSPFRQSKKTVISTPLKMDGGCLPSLRSVRQFFRRHQMGVWLFGCFLLNVLIIATAMFYYDHLSAVSSTAFSPTSNPYPNHLAMMSTSVMNGARADFDSKTIPCILSKSFIFNMYAVSTTKSDASSVLKDSNDYACMQGQEGSLVIELARPIIFQKIGFGVNHLKSSPKKLAILGSADNLKYRSLMKVDLKQMSKEFSYKGTDTAPIKFLKVQILSNWGAQVTTLGKIDVVGRIAYNV